MERSPPMLAVSLAFARLVIEPNTTPPQITDDGVLIVQRYRVYVGGCPQPDAGLPDGALPDAATADAPGDAGVPDAAVGDAGVGDAGPGCETIEGDAVSMVVRPRFTVAPGGARFALLFVTPSRP